MFSGIVERTAEVVSIRTDRQNKDFTLRADFCKELKIDQSIAHNGVCLTVVDITEDTYTVTAMKETLDRSNLGLLREGDLVNLERSMKPTNFCRIEVGSVVNLEFDIVGKYIARLMQNYMK